MRSKEKGRSPIPPEIAQTLQIQIVFAEDGLCRKPPCKRPGPAALRKGNYTSQNPPMQILFRRAGISSPARRTLFQPRPGRKMVAQRREPWVRMTPAPPFYPLSLSPGGAKDSLWRDAHALPPLPGLRGKKKFRGAVATVSQGSRRWATVFRPFAGLITALQSFKACPSLEGSMCRTNAELHHREA